MKIIRNLDFIAQYAEAKEDENYEFRRYLKGKDSKKIDAIVHRLNEEVTSRIDCTQCGNCCRSFMIGLENDDIQRLSKHLDMTEASFEEKYVERSGQDKTKIFNAIPCHFLHENKCTVYEARPLDCREFPHLHKPDFTSRLFGVLYNYSHCPIVFNVFEELKKELHFKSRSR
jgi:Fe-S-cluster containining protein